MTAINKKNGFLAHSYPNIRYRNKATKYIITIIHVRVL